MQLASLILIAFSRMLDGYGMGIITRNGYPIQKCDGFTDLGVGHGMRHTSPNGYTRPNANCCSNRRY